MSCAWLAGHKITKVECPQATNRGAPELFLPITYRYRARTVLHLYGRSSKNLVGFSEVLKAGDRLDVDLSHHDFFSPLKDAV
jgi:hypothetical protein